MKREIKFRAWQPQVKRMFEVGDIDFIKEEVMLCQWGWEALNDIDLMQYAGLNDKNGRKIYEGDVLDIGLRNQDGKPVIAPVSYETYAAGYVLDNGGNGIWQRLTEDCEVIGNIFENPELLEGKQ